MQPTETTPHPLDEVAHRAAAQRLSTAMREGDLTAIADGFAADVVINSPITGAFHFHGRENAVAVLEIVCGALRNLEHDEPVGAGDSWAQPFRALVRGRRLEGVDLMRFDAEGRVRELTVFVRPLPAVTAFAAALAPAVGRRRGLVTSLVLRALIEPLAAITHQGDRLVGWLLRETWQTAH
jgi:hypothetical protein